ncbi:CfaE/CblD family pilus tip adhesin, partial [Yersinia enterocolitica]
MKNHFGKRIFYLLGIIMGILLSLSSAKADEWSRNYHVEATIDLIHPRSVPVWKKVEFKGTLPGGKSAREYLGLVCLSESDTSSGACLTKLRWWSWGWGSSVPDSNVTLRFTNLKTKATVDLIVTGSMWGDACVGYTGFTGVVTTCVGEHGADAVGFETELPETELRKLPYGGVWVAQMRLKTMGWVDNPVGEVVTDIRLNVRSEASIFIPNPTVKLPVTMTGHSEPVTVD